MLILTSSQCKFCLNSFSDIKRVVHQSLFVYTISSFHFICVSMWCDYQLKLQVIQVLYNNTKIFVFHSDFTCLLMSLEEGNPCFWAYPAWIFFMIVLVQWMIHIWKLFSYVIFIIPCSILLIVYPKLSKIFKYMLQDLIEEKRALTLSCHIACLYTIVCNKDLLNSPFILKWRETWQDTRHGMPPPPGKKPDWQRRCSLNYLFKQWTLKYF